GRAPTARFLGALPCLGDCSVPGCAPAIEGRDRRIPLSRFRRGSRAPEGLRDCTSARLKIGPHRSILAASRCRSMPTFERDRVSLYYEEYGSGFPILLFAPGGMRSSIEFWSKSPFDPTRELAGDFRVIAMDQRNAGQSRAPLSASDGWHSYAADHLALLDHLKIDRCHVLGGCIGGSYHLGGIPGAPHPIIPARPPHPTR